jgi:hypothetical protein
LAPGLVSLKSPDIFRVLASITDVSVRFSEDLIWKNLHFWQRVQRIYRLFPAPLLTTKRNTWTPQSLVFSNCQFKIIFTYNRVQRPVHRTYVHRTYVHRTYVHGTYVHRTYVHRTYVHRTCVHRTWMYMYMEHRTYFLIKLTISMSIHWKYLIWENLERISNLFWFDQNFICWFTTAVGIYILNVIKLL